jgi:anti-sigma regulatory factor (Ser/Thr protein kinase)
MCGWPQTSSAASCGSAVSFGVRRIWRVPPAIESWLVRRMPEAAGGTRATERPLSTLTAHFDLPLNTHAPRYARHVVATVLASWGLSDDEWSDAAATVVSELVGNAVRHGGGAVVLDLEAHARQAVVSVSDGSSVVPRRREPDGTGGLGIALIEALTARWYVESHRGGKRVRAELLPCPDDAAEAGSRATTTLSPAGPVQH